MQHIKTIIEQLFNVKIKSKTERETTMKNKNRKKSYVCYVYGQIYDGFLRSNKATVFLIENVHVREWKNILNWLKRHQHIQDFALGDTIQDAAKLIIKGFNEENKIYEKYLIGVEKNLKAA